MSHIKFKTNLNTIINTRCSVILQYLMFGDSCKKILSTSCI